MFKYGANSWRAHNQHLEASNARLQRIITGYKGEVEGLNRERKMNQEAAAAQLGRLEGQWAASVAKNADIECACQVLEADIQNLRAEALAR
eukprot:SM000168S02602  [mRNA]  locus=s168:154108:154957:+ [translate_table: standard]